MWEWLLHSSPSSLLLFSQVELCHSASLHAATSHTVRKYPSANDVRWSIVSIAGGGSDTPSDRILRREGMTSFSRSGWSLPPASTACKSRQVLNLHRLIGIFRCMTGAPVSHRNSEVYWGAPFFRSQKRAWFQAPEATSHDFEFCRQVLHVEMDALKIQGQPPKEQIKQVLHAQTLEKYPEKPLRTSRLKYLTIFLHIFPGIER